MLRSPFRGLSELVRQRRRTRSNKLATLPRTRRPLLELLEDRLAPAAQLSVVPITWSVIGLGSNNVNVGPNIYPVAVRVTNDSADTATNVRTAFTFDAANDPDGLSPYIHLADGQTSDLSIPSLAPGESFDFYYNVVVDRGPRAYATASRYFITASADNAGEVFTPRPRELYVEYLISQNRNTDILITGPTTVAVGGAYTYHFTSTTAPGGYEQLTSYLTFPVSYQILSVSTTYTAPVGGTNDSVYADAAGFQDDPALESSRPNSRSASCRPRRAACCP
jgi:trimeric autotransporter adhesin